MSALTGSLDMVVRGGRVVTAGFDAVADVGISGGRVVAIAESLGRADQDVDARGRLVLPGGFDAHVHLTPVELPERSLAWADDFASGSRAAAAGGITTVGNVSFSRPGEGIVAAYRRVAGEAERESIVDVVLHPVLLHPETEIDELEELRGLGAGSVKIFQHLFDFDAKAPQFVAALERAGGLGLLTMIHCEDACVISVCTEQLVRSGRVAISNFPATRPVPAEVAAIERAIAYSEVTGSPIYIVHLSSERALRAASDARARGVRIQVETRPIYLLFTEATYQGPEPGLYVGNPPLRAETDSAALWTGLATGGVATCCTDHAPWSREQKLAPEVSIRNTRPGMADLETMMPSLFSEGVLKGRLSLERFVEITSTNAARIFGLYPRKGTITVGGDADLIVWDPDLKRRVTGAELYTNARCSLLEGRELTGWPVATIRRGELIFDQGRIVPSPGRGRLVAAGAPAPDAAGATALGRTVGR